MVIWKLHLSIAYFSHMFCALIGKGLSASHTLRVVVLQDYISCAHVLASAANASDSMQTAVSIAQRCKYQACGKHVDQHTAEYPPCLWSAAGVLMGFGRQIHHCMQPL